MAAPRRNRELANCAARATIEPIYAEKHGLSSQLPQEVIESLTIDRCAGDGDKGLLLLFELGYCACHPEVAEAKVKWEWDLRSQAEQDRILEERQERKPRYFDADGDEI